MAVFDLLNSSPCRREAKPKASYKATFEPFYLIFSFRNAYLIGYKIAAELARLRLFRQTGGHAFGRRLFSVNERYSSPNGLRVSNAGGRS